MRGSMSTKVFINADNKATFKCPTCGRTKSADVSRYKTCENAVHVSIKCSCGHEQTVLLERRKHIRKPVNLSGSFQHLDKENRGRIKIVEMSRSGLRIEVFNPSDFNIGDRLKLTFKLNDEEQTSIVREVFIKSIKDKFIGVEFTSLDHYDKLGSFILYNIE